VIEHCVKSRTVRVFNMFWQTALTNNLSDICFHKIWIERKQYMWKEEGVVSLFLSTYILLLCIIHLVFWFVLYRSFLSWLFVFLLWIRVLFSLDLPSWAIYVMNVSQACGLDSSCERLSLTAGLNNFFGYLATLVLDIVYLEQIYSLTIFIHVLTNDESHK
jgi:hypothetical protein